MITLKDVQEIKLASFAAFKDMLLKFANQNTTFLCLLGNDHSEVVIELLGGRILLRAQF